MPAISFLPFLQTVPLGTRLITLTLILSSVVGQGLSILAAQNSPVSENTYKGIQLPWLVMVPGKSIWYPWTLLSAGFVELGIFGLITSVVTVPLACRYLERVWGFKELLRFTAIVVVGSNIIAFGFSWIIWFVLGQEEALFGLPYHGLSGLQVGFLVAFTQLIPEHQVQLLGKFKVKVKSLPGIHLLISNVLVLVLGSSPYILIQFGFFVAWVYLRFFKLSENGEFRGDRSETFAFQYWFPPPIRPYISMAANKVFELAVKVKLVQAWEEPSGSYSLLPGPGGARAEAERRRALALKALDARLASGSPAIPTTSTSSSSISPSAPSSSTVPSAAPISAPQTQKATSATTSTSTAALGAGGDDRKV